jgi:hypothetical protein
MEIVRIVLHHAESVLQSVGIIAGLFFTGFSLRSEARARRIGNLILLTQQHRDIWAQLYERPDLSRVLDPNANILSEPPTSEERLFVRFLILYLGTVYRAIRFDEILRPDGLTRDVKEFFALPIPKQIWSELEAYQDRDFVKFIYELKVLPNPSK